MPSVNDNLKKQLSSLWDQYTELDKADKPAKAAEKLMEIRTLAVQAGSAWDFYRAGSLYIDAVASRNWKQRDQVREEFAAAVKEFDSPIVTYFWTINYAAGTESVLRELLNDGRERLAAECNIRFYGNLGHMNGVLAKHIGSDYEYILWDQYFRNRRFGKELDEAVKDYPGRAYLDYYMAMQYPEGSRYYDVKKVMDKWSGTGVSFYARQELLRLDYIYKRNKTSEDYKGFYKQFKDFVSDKKRLSGEEAAIAANLDYAADMCGTLTDKKLGIRNGGNTVAVDFQNLENAVVTLYRSSSGSKDQEVCRWKVKNKTGSFYLTDSETITLPGNLDDGDYLIVATKGRLSAETLYKHYTVSLAWRKDTDGYKVYAASWLSGESLPSATFHLCRKGRTLKSETISLDGFTLLPEQWIRMIDEDGDARYTLFCSVTDPSGITRRSPDTVISKTWLSGSSNSGYSATRCRIFRDRGAYNPGDVMKFKVLVYEGNNIDRLTVLPDAKVTAVLYNSEDKELERKEFTTGEFGSVAGEFRLPEGERNGKFRLAILVDGKRIDSDSFRVDSFVLPTFDLKFEPQDTLYMPGDIVRVKGKVTSYSGHTLVGANIHFNVLRWGSPVFRKDSAPEEDGSFVLSFPSVESGVYVVEATVTDATGETQLFRTYLFINNSIHVRINPLNGADGSFTLLSDSENPEYRIIRDPFYQAPPRTILRGGKGLFEVFVTDSDGDKVPGHLKYELTDENKAVLKEGKASSGDTVEMDFSSLPDGLYTLRVRCEVEGRKVWDENSCIILKQEGSVIDAPVRRLYITGQEEVLRDEDIEVWFGSADGPTWAVVTLFGDCNQVLETRMLRLAGERGEEGNFTKIAFPYKDSYPAAVRVAIFYFKYGRGISWDQEFTLRRTVLDLPLSFSTFTDESAPGTTCTFTLQTAPGTEALAAVYDKSIDAIAPNNWSPVKLRGFRANSIYTSTSLGSITGFDPETGDVYVTEHSPNSRYGSGAPLLEPEPVYSTPAPDGGKGDGEEEDPVVRTSFQDALCFEPFLRAGEDGKLQFSFRTSDKLSTYYVHVYAHDKDMRNAMVRREMLVTMPVKVAMEAPGYLYDGDVLKPSISVSNSSEKPVSGTLKLFVYPGEDYNNLKPVSVKSVPVTVPARGVKNVVFDVPASGKCRGLKAVFSAGELSDAMFVQVPVYGRKQTLTESHSAVLTAGASRSRIISRLSKEFVNTTGSKAECSEISVLDMLREAIPSKKKPYGTDVLSLSEAYYVRLLAAELDGTDADESELLEKILACRNADGGFGWFRGMSSSMMITAVVLERFARLETAGFVVPDLSASAAWLDGQYFSTSKPYWCGWISDAQYMYVRSLYPEVPFKVKGNERLADFKADAVKYLVPSKDEGRGLKGRILDKARRLRTLQNLTSTTEGLALAKVWGVTCGKEAMRASLQADLESLLDYAVKHPDGGWYYPNAVLPWRGLLETEAYVHSLLCDLMSSVGPVADGITPLPYEVADGIRIWLMLQKETQKWGDEPAFVDALTSIMHGSDEVLDTKVIVLKAEYTKPFVDIKAAGNGFTIERKFVNTETGKEVRPGDVLPAGARITAHYNVWNQENRSFVRLTATREASLRPEDQLSGLCPGGGYRDVRTDRTEYWFDSYPEENTVITEEFFVTQAGTFSAPVITIESLYAPHYRANAGFQSPLNVKW